MKRLLLAALAFAPLRVWGSGYFGVSGGGGGVPTGPAGGVLSGTYPNPSFAVDRVRITGDTMTGPLRVSGTVIATNDIQAGLAGVSSGTLATCTSGGSNCGSFAQVTNGESRLVGPAALTLYSGGNERLAFSSGGVPTVELPYSWPFVVRTGDTMTGRLGIPSPLAAIDAANKAYVDAAIAGVSVSGDFVLKSGDTMTGNLVGLAGTSIRTPEIRGTNDDTRISVQDMQLYDNLNTLTIDGTTRSLKRSDGNERFNWQSGVMLTSGGVTSLQAEQGWLGGFGISGVTSVAYFERKLKSRDGQSVLTWSPSSGADDLNVRMDGGTIYGVPNPTTFDQVANKDYVDTAILGVSVGFPLTAPSDTTPQYRTGGDNDSGLGGTGDGSAWLMANGFKRVDVQQNLTTILGPVTVTGEIQVGDRIVNVPTPINPTDAANKAYVDGISVNITGSPNTLTYFTSSTAIASAPHWGMSDEGKMSWNDTFVSGVTVSDGADFLLGGTFQSGSVNENRSFVRINPNYESGSVLNSLQGFNYAPTINTPFQNQTIFDIAPVYDGNADFSNTTVFNVHDLFNGGSQASNGYVGYGVDITVSSAAYVSGYNAFQDNSDFLEGASVGTSANIITFGSYPQIGVTVGGYFGTNVGANFNQGARLNNAYSFNSNTNAYPGSYIDNFISVNLGNGFQSGSTVNFFTGVNNTPGFSTPLQSYRGYNEAPNFQSGSSSVNPVIVDIHPYWQAGSTMDGNLLGININPAWDAGATLAGTSSATLLNINPGSAAVGFNSFTGADINLGNVTGAQQVTGLSINVGGVTVAGGIAAYGINQNGGFVQSNYQSIWPDIGFFQFNYLGGQAIVPAGQPVASGFAFGLNLASGLHAEANVGDDGTGLNLGFADVGFVGSMEILSGVTVDAVTMALGGAGVPAGSTGGTIEDASMFSAAGFLPQGGTVNVTNMKGFRAMPTLCVVASGTCRGLSIEDPAASNYLASTVTLDGLTANRVAILDSTKTVAASSVTDTELGYLSGATANIQTQLNAKSSGSDLDGVSAALATQIDGVSVAATSLVNVSSAALQSSISANSTSIAALQGTTAATAAQIAALQVATGTQATQITALQGATTSLSAAVAALQGVTVDTWVRKSGDTMSGNLRLTGTTNSTTHTSNPIASDGGISALGALFSGVVGSGTGGRVRLKNDSGVEGWRTGYPGSAGASSYVFRDVIGAADRIEITTAGNVVINTAGAGLVLEQNGGNTRLETVALSGVSTLVSNTTITANSYPFVQPVGATNVSPWLIGVSSGVGYSVGATGAGSAKVFILEGQ